MKSYDDQVVSFSGERVGIWGYIDLYTTFGEGKASKTIKIRYLVIDTNTSYNIFLDRQSINRLRAIVSTPHLAMKFLSASGDILTVHVDQKCYAREPWGGADEAGRRPWPIPQAEILSRTEVLSKRSSTRAHGAYCCSCRPQPMDGRAKARSRGGSLPSTSARRRSHHLRRNDNSGSRGRDDTSNIKEWT